MTKEEKFRWDKMEHRLAEIHTALVGNETLGLRGLVERQNDNEEYQKHATKDLEGIKASLKKLHVQHKSILELQGKYEARLVVVERFTESYKSIVSTLKGIKKRTVVWVGGVIAFLSALATMWKELMDIFN